MDITFYGAAEEVTGSCFLVKGGNTTVLIDCGLFQGGRFAETKNYNKLPFACDQIHHILVTHAHLDHTGRLPQICLDNFEGNVLATAPTLELIMHLLADAVEIMEIEYQESGRVPLYTIEQVERLKQYFTGVKYGEKIMLTQDDYAIFHDAGHILGSAFIELVIDGKRCVFSGDVGNLQPPIIRETSPLPSNIDLLVCESTYGHKNHEKKSRRENELVKVVLQTIRQKGVLMIPSFAIERTQEILYLFNNLVEKKVIPPIPIFLDSPLAAKATRVFKKYPDFYNEKDYLSHQVGDGLFDFPGLKQTKTRKQSKHINLTPSPKIIIAGSGMMNGGRILFHLQEYLGRTNSSLFIVGYQARGTLGRKILNGQKNIKIFNRDVSVKASIKSAGAFSAHADQKKFLSWFAATKNIKQIALTHGELDGMKIFSNVIEKRIKVPTLIPKPEQTIHL